MKYSFPVRTHYSYTSQLMTNALIDSEEAYHAQEKWLVGQLVTLCQPCYQSNPVGTIGVVYQVDTEDPNEVYVAIILETGDDCNLIAETAVHEQFISLGREDFTYDYQTPDALMADFTRGVFTPLIQTVHQLLQNRG